MTKIKVEGGYELTGEVMISGAKNSVVALMPAAILCDEEVCIDNVPNISDVDALEDILSYLGARVSRKDGRVIIDSSKCVNKMIDEDMACRLRASYYFMGALLGRYGKAMIALPGGCTIGQRPIDLHLKGFQQLGAEISYDGDLICLSATKLKGCHICLPIASVGATINIMLASVRAEGMTVIENAALEPEIVNVAKFLVSMGANISGAGTSIITITGVNYLKSGSTIVIPDRIEAGTYLIMGALLGNNLCIRNVIPMHLMALIDKLKEASVNIFVGTNYLIVNRSSEYKPVDIETAVYPGFPTDLQQPMIPFLTQCDGVSQVFERIYENRFMNVYDTINMGAKIVVKDNEMAIVYGKTDLVGREIQAFDLRGGASLLICGLIATGETIIDGMEYILRGYEDVIGKLKKIGAKVSIIEEGK